MDALFLSLTYARHLASVMPHSLLFSRPPSVMGPSLSCPLRLHLQRSLYGQLQLLLQHSVAIHCQLLVELIQPVQEGLCRVDSQQVNSDDICTARASHRQLNSDKI